AGTTAKRSGKGTVGSRRVQWRDTAGEHESEGEEEAIEKQEILEAAISDVMDAATGEGEDEEEDADENENDDQGESDGNVGMEEDSRTTRKSGSRR
ncbi:tau 95 subunit of transcription factor TFIIIC, partial [Aspergillus hancockii]